MLRDAAASGLRRLLLAHARRVPQERARQRAAARALVIARWAATCSAAYRQLLAEHGITPARLAAGCRLTQLPVLSKAATFGRFSVAELARPVASRSLADVLTSSGQSGGHFGFRLTERHEHDRAWFDIDLGLEDAFKVGAKSTLLVNCLPMGVVFGSRAVTVANVSVRADMACAILRDIGPRFEQTLLCTDPLFIRRVLDEGRAAGVDWAALNTSVIVGEECLVEAQRDHIAHAMGMDPECDPHRMVGSSFGVGELGLNLLFETRETLRIRRAARRVPALAALLTGAADSGALPTVFCYSPHRLFVEVIDPDEHGFGELCLTLLSRRAVIPLPRFATGDVARLLGRAEVAQAAHLAGVAPPWLPVVLVSGRRSDRSGSGPSVEEVKELIYADSADANLLSGAFRMDLDAQGRGTILVQALAAATADAGDCQARLAERAAGMGWTAQLAVVAPADFPGRPMLDYERKLPYRSAV